MAESPPKLCLGGDVVLVTDENRFGITYDSGDQGRPRQSFML